MRLTNQPIAAWLCCPDSATVLALAVRLREARAVDAVRLARGPEYLPVSADLIIAAGAAEQLLTDGWVAAVRAVSPQATVLAALRTAALSDVVDLLSEGVDAVVDLDATDGELAHGVRAAARDRSYVPREYQAGVLSALIRRRRRGAESRMRIARLTPKEREILAQLSDGVDRSTIAARYRESPSLVRARIDRAKAKLGVPSQREALAMLADATSAVETGPTSQRT